MHTDALQIYPGYSEEDVALVRKYATVPAELHADHYVDGFGQKTLHECVPFCRDFDKTRLGFPIPQDGYHAEGIEYVALVDSIDRAKARYSIVEIGAAWGPWTALGGVLARRQGFAAIDIVAVEADPARFKLLQKHLAFNGLLSKDAAQDANGQITSEANGIKCHLFHGAVGTGEQSMWFPLLPVTDMGAAAAADHHSQDYRGVAVTSFEVKAYPLAEALRGLTAVDLLHIDIQGAEFEVIAHNIDLITNTVSGLMIGTHSRVIEGRLIELLEAKGWHLHGEKPCRVDWNSSAATLVGRTTVDGGQYWRRK